MTRENATVTAERARLANEFEAGQQDGYAANPNPQPEWYSKPYMHMTARQRGWIFGQLLQEWERGKATP